jgi:hypothetical protein
VGQPAAKTDTPTAALVLADAGDPMRLGRDFDYRLKLGLKRMLRDFGLWCVSCGDRLPGAGRPHQPEVRDES